MIYCINLRPCITTDQVAIELTTKASPRVPVITMGIFHGETYARAVAEHLFRPDAAKARAQAVLAA